ncbi:hypothetical protein [Cytobacillus oceanisediminis]|uniref:hypothetical protein n=1 Tax=Cytobacillus oceanisediminis TaxID=665099 RepID=UPI00203EF3D6|nr:hypothetical protein [Cytobacillus oceanisediminis]MCM3403288.1 hypothetical protein [Cytobacillus oceanisediminis]MDK7667742.1 hypothetical protein [Cytobacillus oceanisediminis]
MYAVDPLAGPKLILLIAIVVALMYFFELGLRKWLKVGRRNFFLITISMINIKRWIGPFGLVF